MSRVYIYILTLLLDRCPAVVIYLLPVTFWEPKKITGNVQDRSHFFYPPVQVEISDSKLKKFLGPQSTYILTVTYNMLYITGILLLVSSYGYSLLVIKYNSYT